MDHSTLGSADARATRLDPAEVGRDRVVPRRLLLLFVIVLRGSGHGHRAAFSVSAILLPVQARQSSTRRKLGRPLTTSPAQCTLELAKEPLWGLRSASPALKRTHGRFSSCVCHSPVRQPQRRRASARGAAQTERRRQPRRARPLEHWRERVRVSTGTRRMPSQGQASQKTYLMTTRRVELRSRCGAATNLPASTGPTGISPRRPDSASAPSYSSKDSKLSSPLSRGSHRSIWKWTVELKTKKNAVVAQQQY